MKKILKNKHRKPSLSSTRLRRSSKFSPAVALLSMAVMATSGILLLKAGLAATTVTYYGQVQIKVVNTGGYGLGGATVGIQSSVNSGFICRNSAGGSIWNPSNGVSYSNTDGGGWAVFASCIVYQGAYSSFTAAPSNQTFDYRLISVSLGGWRPVACSFATVNQAGLFPVNGTKNGNGTLPITYQLTCMEPIPAPPPPPTPPPVPPPTPPPTPPVTPPNTPPPAPTPTPPPSSHSSPPSSSSPAASIKKPVSPPPPAPAVIKATSGDRSPPSAPSNFVANQKDKDAVLSWTAATDNVAVSGYNLENSTNQVDWTPIASGISDTTFTDKALGTNTTYYYRLRAIDTSGNESDATFADLEIPASDAPAQSDSPVPNKEKASSGNAALKIGGTLLILLALMGGLFWFFRIRKTAESLDDDIRMNSVNSAIDSTMLSSPHASESLKDMVMHNMDRDDKNK
jgi:hypothetical protein